MYLPGINLLVLYSITTFYSIYPAPKWHYIFKAFFLNLLYMPNSANKSNSGGSNANQGQPKHHTSRSSSKKDNPERSDIKHSSEEANGQREKTSRSSNQGRKEASGG